jgi:hypothetical protein
MRPWIGALLLLPLLGFRQGPGWQLVAPQHLRQTGSITDPRMAETSGAAVSRRQPGIIWTIDDSGNPPELIASDTLGRFRASISLDGASNTDWEDVALGPCHQATCVYIADTGDNNEVRPEVRLYRLIEPTVAVSNQVPGRSTTKAFEMLRFRYPDGPHDVEAMGVTTNGDVLLVTKGRSHGVLEFRIPPSAWASSAVVTADRIDSLPIAASASTGQLITGMAIAPDGRRAMVRSYREIFPFVLRTDGTLRPPAKPTSCDILGVEPQGEGIAFLDDRQLVLTSERGLFKAGTVFVLECPVE